MVFRSLILTVPAERRFPQVVETMTDYLFNHNANTHWAYPTSNETDEIMDYSRQALADFFNASADEIAFGQNMTSLTFIWRARLGREFHDGRRNYRDRARPSRQF